MDKGEEEELICVLKGEEYGFLKGMDYDVRKEERDVWVL